MLARHMMVAVGLLGAAALPASAERFAGEVLEIGRMQGLAGVVVVVRNAAQKQVGNGNTDDKGAYAIDIPSPGDGPYTARYEKIGYHTFPTIKPGVTLGIRQPKVYLAQGNGGADYNKNIAANYVREAALDKAAASSLASMVAGLPASDRQAVVDQLKVANEVTLVADVQTAVVTNRKTAQFLQLFKEKGIAGNAFAYGNAPNLGAIYVWGSVSRETDLKAADELLKSLPDIKVLRNDLRVGKM